MFKTDSFSKEIMQSMEDNLIASNAENAQLNKIARAVGFLNTAAEIFADAKFTEESIAIANIIKTLKK